MFLNSPPMKVNSVDDYKRPSIASKIGTRLATSGVFAATVALSIVGCVAPPQQVVVRERVVERPPAPQPQVHVMPPPIREDRGPGTGTGSSFQLGARSLALGRKRLALGAHGVLGQIGRASCRERV